MESGISIDTRLPFPKFIKEKLQIRPRLCYEVLKVLCNGLFLSFFLGIYLAFRPALVKAPTSLVLAMVVSGVWSWIQLSEMRRRHANWIPIFVMVFCLMCGPSWFLFSLPVSAQYLVKLASEVVSQWPALSTLIPFALLISRDQDFPIHTTKFLDILGNPPIRRWEFDTMAAAATFQCLVLCRDLTFPIKVFDVFALLDTLIPDQTDIWMAWKNKVADCIAHEAEILFAPTIPTFGDQRQERLKELLDQAQVGYDAYRNFYDWHVIATPPLDPARPQDRLVEQGIACEKGVNWEDALNDANEAIRLDPSSPSGYERKYIALLGMRRIDDASNTLETMLSKVSESSDLGIRERSRHYIRPEQTKKAIRTSIKNAIRNSPPVLINTLTGHLCNKSDQVATFESTPSFTTLIASVTTSFDRPHVDKVVGEFYRYATLSHTWEGNEPLYEEVIRAAVYKLKAFPTHKKLQMFCTIARDKGLVWAWSDTCCINKADHFVLQEALVMMFKWYEGSAVTIIFLCDVDRLAEIGALTMSIWNSRGWTLQEYHASKVVQIYTKDWTPYLGLTVYNHKESPEIISEMEKATGISAQSLMALRPGLNDIREKLRLASTRQTTRVEDAAYSLLGIFSVTLPVTYGEGDQALGRLLSQLLMSTTDTTILAWTGTSGSFNSCLPTNISVFSHSLTSYIPPAITDAEMGIITAELLATPLDLNLATVLYERLEDLPTPLFVGQRMKLPCLAFEIRTLSRFTNGSEVIFRARADALGTVEIRTKKNLMKLDSLYLAHPWIDFLLDRRSTIVWTPVEDELSELDKFPSCDSSRDISTNWHVKPSSFPSSSTVDAQTRVYQFLARLRRPFGALLLTRTIHNAYKRVNSESLVSVQVEEITSPTLDELIQSVRVMDVL